MIGEMISDLDFLTGGGGPSLLRLVLPCSLPMSPGLGVWGGGCEGTDSSFSFELANLLIGPALGKLTTNPRYFIIVHAGAYTHTPLPAQVPGQ